MQNELVPTETTYRLVSKLGFQRKWRTFAEITVWRHASGLVSADMSYFNYKTGRREYDAGGWMPVAQVAPRVAQWITATSPEGGRYERQQRVIYHHFEVA
jgi:hypothetical protein